MRRWIAIPMILMVWACKEKNEGTVSGALSSARSQADSALAEGRAKGDTALAGARANADTALAGARANADTALAGVRAKSDTALAGARANADTALVNARGTAERALRGGTSTTQPAAPNSAGNADSSAKPGSGEAAMSPAREAHFDLSGLSSDQIKELQTALNKAGCKAGPADGIVGQRTQRAIACGMHKNNIEGQDPKPLYQALHLDFGS